MRWRKGGGDFVDFAKIESAAQQVLESYGYSSIDAVEIVDLARKEGFVVGEAHFADHSDGMILVNMKEKQILGQDTQKIILVNRDLESDFKRFVIAHELGHYFLDGNNQNKNYILAHRDTNVRDDDEHEQEMDYFAACLLMPRTVFLHVLNVAKAILDTTKVTPDLVALLASYFQVPSRSVERRIGEVTS